MSEGNSSWVLPPINLGQDQSQDSNNSQSGEPQYSEFVQGILAEIPDTERDIVGKHFSTWEKNVHGLIAKKDEQYKPYTELGDVDVLKEQLEWIGHMNQDPVKFWKDLKELLVEAGYDVNDNGTPAPVEKSIPPEWADIPESFISKFNEMETLVSTLTGQVTETKAEMERRQAKEELDTYLGTMHTKHGKFDDTYVIAQMALGVDAEKAIEAFQSMLKEYGAVEPKNTNPGNTNNNPPAPKVITGGGNVVQGEQDIRKLDDRSRRAFLIKALEQASGE